MKLNLAAGLAFLLVTVTTGVLANDFTIDDFSTGTYLSPQYRNGQHSSSQYGSMRGENRSTTIFVCSTPADCNLRNPFKQVASYTFQAASATSPSAFIASAGFEVYPRIDMGYGAGAPMSVNFTPYIKTAREFQRADTTLEF